MATHQPPEDSGMEPGVDLSEELVAKVGAAAGKVALIQDSYTAQAHADPRPEARHALATQARIEAEQVIGDEGLSIEAYNAVLTAAESDPDLEQRLIAAAKRFF